jgi:hypothetical protein
MIIIDAPHFYAAVILKGDTVGKAAPIVRYMVGWSRARVIEYCKRKKYKTLLIHG